MRASLNERTGMIEENQRACHWCGHEFTCAQGLRRHLLIHTGETPFNCFHCDYASNRKESLKSHCIRTHEMTPEEFQLKAKAAFPPKPTGRPRKKPVAAEATDPLESFAEESQEEKKE